MDDVMLKYPDFSAAKEGECPFIIETGASRLGIAGVPSQSDESHRIGPIYVVSRKCNLAERHYSATELGALTVKYTVDKFTQFILGFSILLFTHHQALMHVCKREFSDPELTDGLLRYRDLS